MKKLLLTTAVSGLMISAALAQSPAPDTSNAPANKPAAATTAPAPAMNADHAAKPQAANPDNAAKPAATAAAGSEPQFITEQGTDKFVFSKFNGADVVGPDNKKIGDVSDVVFDKNNTILAYVVGVGGFLGIGEKSVAIAPSAFTPWHDPNDKSASNDPNNVKLKVSFTKDQLKNAPDFKYYKAPANTASGSGAATTGAGPIGSPRH